MFARIFTFSALVVLGLAIAACAGTNPSVPAGAPSVEAPEQVQITLSEFKVESSKTNLVKGKPYRFVVKNNGSVAHEWVIAPRGEKEDSKFLTEVEEDDLPAGGNATHEYTFTQAGDYEMACHVPGHYESNMILPITVQ